ncbi:MAG: ATP-binding cassette domain-containing protein [Thermodesulfobacteriota bacterium]|nr:ATP-binding cassette domain-containing protein [Thermodesulfobacteriota bacterium]
MITLNHVQKQFGSRVLLQDCSLQIGARDRIGLIGPNGSGKTTLFRMILGEESIDGGEILIAKGVKMGYLPQEVISFKGDTVLNEVLKSASSIISLQDKMKILEEELSSIDDPKEQERLAKEYGKLHERYTLLGGYGLEAEAKQILQGLGFKERDFNRATDELSGGWLMRIALSKILLQSPDLLLLDEPTNHLDLQSLIWLENFLINYPGAMVIVSHDRVFLNHLIDRIAEIEGEKIDLYYGDYDRYLEEKENRRRILEATYKTQQKKIEQTERFIERFRAKNTKSSQVQSRIKMLGKLERIELTKERKEIRFQFPVPKRSGHRVIEVKNLHKRYGEIGVYQGIDLTFYRGDKVALVGPNGAGKSTLLKILAGVLGCEEGEVILGKDATRAYFAQHQFDLLRPENTVYEELLTVATDESQTQLRTLLGTFLFSGDEIEKRVSILSGGEKSRLVLAKMLLKPANFLLLDEPTSHLDIPSRNVLEMALKQFQGTICLITHDRHLINQIANKVIEIDLGTPNVYLGNYDDYLYKKQQIQMEEAQKGVRLMPSGPEAHPGRRQASPSSQKKKPSVRTKEERRKRAQEMDQFRKQLSALEKRFQEAEKSLQEATRKLDHLNQRLSDPNLYLNQKETYETVEDHKQVKEQVRQQTQLWEFLALELEEMKMMQTMDLMSDAKE